MGIFGFPGPLRSGRVQGLVHCGRERARDRRLDRRGVRATLFVSLDPPDPTDASRSFLHSVCQAIGQDVGGVLAPI